MRALAGADFGGDVDAGEPAEGSSDFASDHNIATFINIPSCSTGGILCKDSAILDKSSRQGVVHEAGERAMDEFRQLSQMLLSFPKWDTLKDLRTLGIGVVLEALKKGAEDAKTKMIAVGCGQGRTRSAAFVCSSS